MPEHASPASILIIDDDAMSRELLCVLLQAEGYAVAAADSGESALAHLRRAAEPPSLILSDLQMPGISGPALAAELRNACGPATLLLAISGSQPPAAAVSGFDGFLLKPFKTSAIAASLAAAKSGAPASSPSPSPASYTNMDSPKASTTLSSTATLDDISAAPILNDTIYQQLARAMPAAQLLEMYTLCVDDARSRIARMRTLATQHDSARFVREAHAIKGSCGMLGATEMHSMATVLEREGLESVDPADPHEVNSLDELSAACDRLERILGSRV
jgi:CheY-like chemotaxis protein